MAFGISTPVVCNFVDHEDRGSRGELGNAKVGPISPFVMMHQFNDSNIDS